MTRLILAAMVLATMASGCGNHDECTDPATLCRWAGTGEPGFDGDGNALLDSMLYWPIDVSFTSSGAYILDWNNHAVRRVEPDGLLRTVIGTGFVGDGPPDLSDKEPPGAPATTIDLNHPTQLVELPTGNLLLVSWHNHKLREYDPQTGLAVIICGDSPGFSGDGNAARNARLNQPTQVVLDTRGGKYVLDMRNQVIRYIDSSGMISTVAGTPAETAYSGDGGPPLGSHFNFPTGSNPPPGGALALDAQGRLYVSDTLNHAIRRIDFEADQIETLAGTGEAGYRGDGGPASLAQLNNPRDLQLSSNGLTLYVADELNHRVRAIDLETETIETVAGTGVAGFEGDGLPTETPLNRPGGLALDADGRLYIADSYNHMIRVFEPGAKP